MPVTFSTYVIWHSHGLFYLLKSHNDHQEFKYEKKEVKLGNKYINNLGPKINVIVLLSYYNGIRNQ